MSDKTVLTEDQREELFEKHFESRLIDGPDADSIILDIERAVLAASEDRRDAERYRWIRDKARNQWDGETAIDVIEAGGRRMDAVIDAAIAAAGNQVEG